MQINENELLSYGDVKAKKIALEIMKVAIESVDPYKVVKNALGAEDNKLIGQGEGIPNQGKNIRPSLRKSCLFNGESY